MQEILSFGMCTWICGKENDEGYLEMRKDKIRILHIAQAAGGVDRYIRIVNKEEYKEFSHSFNEKVETIRKAKAEMNRQRDCLNNLDYLWGGSRLNQGVRRQKGRQAVGLRTGSGWSAEIRCAQVPSGRQLLRRGASFRH